MTPWQVSHVQNVLGPTPSSPWSTQLPRTHLSSLGSRRRKKRSWEHLQPALTPPWEHQHGLRLVWSHTSNRVHADQKRSLNPTTVAPGTGYSTPTHLCFLSFIISTSDLGLEPPNTPQTRKSFPPAPMTLQKAGKAGGVCSCFVSFDTLRPGNRRRSFGIPLGAGVLQPYSCWVKALHLKPLTASTEDPVTGLGT